MTTELSNTGAQDAARIETAIRREGKRRLGSITLSRSIALVAIAGVVAIIAPWPEVLFYQALILLLIVTGILQMLLGRSRWSRDWHVFLFISLDMALLVVTLLSPNPFSPDPLPPQFVLRFGNFIYIFVFISILAITLRPSLPLWAGVNAAVFWIIGIVWLVNLPGSTTEPVQARSTRSNDPTAGEISELILEPGFIDLGIQFQNLLVLLIISVVLSFATRSARRLVIREAGQARRVANLSRYLPVEAIAELANRDDPFAKEREADVAVLFTDIVGFSAMAENQNPHQVIALLREAHQLVEREVFEHGGVLDKFIGDGAMATFGATQARSDAKTHAASNGIACAAAILSAATRWNEDRAHRGLPPVRLSAGLHYGPVVVGDVGSARRTELAVIGDTVNVAARLEVMTRKLNVSACISDEAVAAAGDNTGLKNIGPHPVKGRTEPVTIWTPA